MNTHSAPKARAKKLVIFFDFELKLQNLFACGAIGNAGVKNREFWSEKSVFALIQQYFFIISGAAVTLGP